MVGVNRTVIFIGSYAIKFPSFRNGIKYFVYGMLANMLEYEKWNLSKSPYLMPVYYRFPFGLFTVNKRYYNVLDRLLTKEELDKLPLINFDNNGNNAAIDNGQIIIIDYGNPGCYLVVD